MESSSISRSDRGEKSFLEMKLKDTSFDGRDGMPDYQLLQRNHSEGCMKFNGKFIISVLFLLLTAPLAMGADKVVGMSRSDVSLRQELDSAIGRGLTWLISKQKPEGFWSQQEYPALTGLVLTAFQGDPSGFYKRKYEQPIKKGFDYILKNVKADGGIYGKDLTNYNTSVCMMALMVASNPSYEPVIRKARRFVIGLQDKLKSDDPLDGGIGYGGTYKHSDLSNTYMALEALHYTQYLKSDVANDAGAKDLNWAAAQKFISRCQNLPGSNDQKWASDDPDNKGGFVYFPENSKAGEMKLADGKTVLRSYGSMSYAGLLSYIYAQLGKNDPRVKAVYEWLSRHYTLDENPGMGKDGLYYYYHTMAKALNIYGVNTLTMKDGTKVNWRNDLAKRLLDLQNGEGFWVNESGRWWEKDPALVTSYAVITLEIIRRGL
jgi:squalene-hopene/tetraprenyl-beta-curcumene cyclase